MSRPVSIEDRREPVSVCFVGEPDPARTLAWLRETLALARAAKTARETPAPGVESAA